MSNLRDWTSISIEKSRELRKSWNWRRIAFLSSSPLSEKLSEEQRSMARIPPSFNMTMPSRTSLIGTNSWVALVAADMRQLYIILRIFGDGIVIFLDIKIG